MNENAPTLRDSVRLLGTKRFGTFWVASLLSNIGTWAQQVAEPLLILSLGGSAFLVGLDGFALNAPGWALTLLGGVFADRLDRRRVILLFQSIQAMCPAALMVLIVAGVVRPWHVIVLSVIVGITDALSMPSFSSIVPNLVERSQIGAAYALNSTQFNLSRILGPALSGVLMVQLGALACFGVNTLSYLPFILVALWILPPRPPAPLKEGERRLGNPFAGLGEVLRKPRLLTALGVSLVTSLTASQLVTFAAVLVQDVFNGNASHLGGALSAFGVGGLIGAVALLALEGHIPRWRLSSGFAIAYAAVVIAASQTSGFPLLMLLLVAGGAAMTMSNTSVNTLLQTTARDDLRGQASSLYMLAMRGGLALGSLITGAVASGLGIRRALLINGCFGVVAHAVLAYRMHVVEKQPV